MHGLGSRPIALASDAAGRGDMGGKPLTMRRCRVLPCGFPDSHRHGSNRAVSAENGEIAEMAGLSQNGRVRMKFKKKKKNKKVQNAVFELNLKP